jgi:hypothetical protein
VLVYRRAVAVEKSQRWQLDLIDRLSAAHDVFQHAHALLHQLVGLHVHQIGTGQTVLGDQDRLLAPRNVRDEFSSMALERRDEFGSRGVKLECHLLCSQPQARRRYVDLIQRDSEAEVRMRVRRAGAGERACRSAALRRAVCR